MIFSEDFKSKLNKISRNSSLSRNGIYEFKIILLRKIWSYCHQIKNIKNMKSQKQCSTLLRRDIKLIKHDRYKTKFKKMINTWRTMEFWWSVWTEKTFVFSKFAKTLISKLQKNAVSINTSITLSTAMFFY